MTLTCNNHKGRQPHSVWDFRFACRKQTLLLQLTEDAPLKQ